MIVDWIDRLRLRLASRKALGPRAERAAARYLRHAGYRIRARNLRNRLGEIDIVVEQRDGTIVIVEVKAAARENPPPEVHVNRAKQRKLTALAHQLVRRYRLHDRTIRFDVVAVVWPEGERAPTRLTHHANAFEAQT
jgi:putative endonuclease